MNGQVLSAPELQSSKSMLSLAPATTTFGWFASIAIAGSFCLFCENGLGMLPTVTSESEPGAAPAITAMLKASAAATTSASSFLMILPLFE